VQLAAQELLDGARGRHDDRQAERVDDAEVAGQVDDAEHPPAVGIHDRRRRAGPALDGLGEVLGREDLHGVRGGDRSADRVGPGRRLAPQRTLDEVHVVGSAISQPRVALDAQQHAVRIRDDEQVVGIEQGLGHALLDHRADAQGMLLPHRTGAADLDDGLCGQAPAGIDAGVARAHPGVGDRAAHVGRAGILVGALQAILDEVLPGVTQLTGPLGRDRVGIDGDPGAQRQGLTFLGTSWRSRSSHVPTPRPHVRPTEPAGGSRLPPPSSHSLRRARVATR